MALKTIRSIFSLLKKALSELKKNDPLRLAGATAFFTTFALPPILILLLQLFTILFNNQNLTDTFFLRLADILGKESTAQVKYTFTGFKSLAKNGYITLGGAVFLMFVATTLFKIIKESLNQIWNIKVNSRRAFKLKLQKRIISMVVILLAGILFMTGILIESMQALLGEYVGELFANTGWFFDALFHKIFSVVIVTLWFAILFKVLPDARPSWKTVIVGGLFTGILFTMGKIIIRYMLAYGNISTVFGASSSIVLLLLFVFYSAFILYYGACFTKVYALSINDPIKPGLHAFKYEIVEIATQKAG